jgi:hypothetical protein
MKNAWTIHNFPRNAFNVQYRRFWDCNDPDIPPSLDWMEEVALDEYIPQAKYMHVRRLTAANPGVVWGDDYNKPYPQGNKHIYIDHNWKEVTNPTPEQLKVVYDRRDIFQRELEDRFPSRSTSGTSSSTVTSTATMTDSTAATIPPTSVEKSPTKRK